MDKIKLAHLLSYLSVLSGRIFDEREIREIEGLAVPVQSAACIANVNEMMSAMAQGRKIEAIKWHRTITGFGLKESRDAIESAYAGRDR